MKFCHAVPISLLAGRRAATAVHLALDQLELCDLAFGLTV
jgi:hypothetical protein